MKSFFARTMLAICGLLLASNTQAAESGLIPALNPFGRVPTGSQQPIRFVSNDALLTAPQEESTMNVEAVTSATPTICPDGGCGEAAPCYVYVPRTSKLTLGGEAMLLKPFQSDGDFGMFNYDIGYRVWAAWQREDGLGIRGRYFDYFQRVPNNFNNLVDTIAFHAADMEVFDEFQLGDNWTVIAGAGVRYLDFADNILGDDIFSGLGPVATLEGYRRLNDRFSLYAIGRCSILADGGANQARGEEDVTLSTLELQFGLQYIHQLANGSNLFARVGWEAQQYDDSSNSEESITLIGGSFSAGWLY